MTQTPQDEPLGTGPNPEIRIIAVRQKVLLVNAVVGAVFVFLLATGVFGTAMGIGLGLLTLIPLVGLIVLLLVNGKATRVLRDNGISVGLLGAKDIPPAQ